jgi:hypothetical protein
MEIDSTILSKLKPISEFYWVLPILEGFNLAECLEPVADGKWYLVIFRSIRKVDANV